MVLHRRLLLRLLITVKRASALNYLSRISQRPSENRAASGSSLRVFENRQTRLDNWGLPISLRFKLINESGPHREASDVPIEIHCIEIEGV